MSAVYTHNMTVHLHVYNKHMNIKLHNTFHITQWHNHNIGKCTTSTKKKIIATHSNLIRASSAVQAEAVIVSVVYISFYNYSD